MELTLIGVSNQLNEVSSVLGHVLYIHVLRLNMHTHTHAHTHIVKVTLLACEGMFKETCATRILCSMFYISERMK